TQPGGRPHAETVALARAGEQARGATSYVTLEPCCHWGQTPPCTSALIEAGIARVVIGARDPDPRVNGQGIAALRAAGIEVIEGVLASEAGEAIAGFAMRVRENRPLVMLKLASTLDGRIATRTGESRWITGEPARRMTHALRGRHDAVLVGIGTVLADDPELTCRLAGFRAVPVVRIVADSALRTPVSARVLMAGAPTWLLARADADPGKCAAVEALGATVIAVGLPETPPPNSLPQGEGGLPNSIPPPLEGGGRGRVRSLDLKAALSALGAARLTSVLVEGGASLAASLLQSDLVDRIAWFHAPSIMGGDGLAAIRDLGLDRLAELPRFRRHSAIALGDDMLTTFERAA
ncbi:MAG: bifunctional diaminohydroxyphosphoribosylaminopyrimidine deaminase/5-amino-6-(5-phosphoribosylamino)uracil reductase RibD, partial [Acetobacteraceae bacterium]